MFFTQEDFKKIEEYLKKNSKRDTDLPRFKSGDTLLDKDVLAVVHNGINYKVPIKVLAEAIDKYRDDYLKENIASLQNQINCLVKGGSTVGTTFGDSDDISVSQRALTIAFNKVWNKISELTGEQTTGISMTVNPPYYVGEDGCTVHITVHTSDTNGLFDKLKLYVNDQLLVDRTAVDYYEQDIEITESAVIRCEAEVLGLPYIEQRAIIHYPSFWIGAGPSYTSIMDIQHNVSTLNGISGSVNISISEDSHIYVVVVDSLRSGFRRLDMNGIEIPFNETSVVIDGRTYQVLTSVSTFSAGVYNIDINS